MIVKAAMADLDRSYGARERDASRIVDCPETNSTSRNWNGADERHRLSNVG
jgi:hypothetical protein